MGTILNCNCEAELQLGVRLQNASCKREPDDCWQSVFKVQCAIPYLHCSSVHNVLLHIMSLNLIARLLCRCIVKDKGNFTMEDWLHFAETFCGYVLRGGVLKEP